MSNVNWKVELRDQIGKGAARKLRAAGKLPAVAYGPKTEATPLTIEYKLVEDLIREGAWNQALIKLEVPGRPEFAEKVFMIRELQRQHITYQPLTLDLYSIRMDEQIEVDIPVHVEGSEEIKRRGGFLEVLNRELTIRCLPGQIPSHIQVDATELELGHTLHLSDLVLPENTETDLPPDTPICSAMLPRAEEETPVAEEGEGEEAAAEGEAEGTEEGEKDKKEEEA